MHWTYLLHVVELLSFYGVLLYVCARIGGITREGFRRGDRTAR